MNICIPVVAVSMSLLVLIPARVAAQTPPADWSVSVGQSITVTTSSGGTVAGTVLGVSALGIELQSKRDAAGKASATRRVVEAHSIRRISVSDSRRDGAGKGALVLGVPALLLTAGTCHHRTLGGCNDSAEGKSAGLIVGGTLACASVGALFGVLFDSLKHQTVFDANSVGTSVSVRPLVGAGGRGLGLRVVW